MDLQKDLLALLHTFNNDTWRSSRLSCFRWILTYFRLRLNLPFLNWLILRFSDRGMSFRFSDCEISPVYEEFCAIMDYYPSGEEFLALPPDPSSTYDVLLRDSPIQISPDSTMPHPHNIPLAPFLQRAQHNDGSTQWSHCLCYLFLNVFTMVSPFDGYGDIRLLSVSRQITLGGKTPHLLILGETMNWVYNTATRPDVTVPLRGCPILLQVLFCPFHDFCSSSWF